LPSGSELQEGFLNRPPTQKIGVIFGNSKRQRLGRRELFERQKVMEKAPGKHRFEDKVRGDRMHFCRWMKSIPKDVIILGN